MLLLAESSYTTRTPHPRRSSPLVGMRPTSSGSPRRSTAANEFLHGHVSTRLTQPIGRLEKHMHLPASSRSAISAPMRKGQQGTAGGSSCHITCVGYAGGPRDDSSRSCASGRAMPFIMPGSGFIASCRIVADPVYGAQAVRTAAGCSCAIPMDGKAVARGFA